MLLKWVRSKIFTLLVWELLELKKQTVFSKFSKIKLSLDVQLFKPKNLELNSYNKSNSEVMIFILIININIILGRSFAGLFYIVTLLMNIYIFMFTPHITPLDRNMHTVLYSYSSNEYIYLYVYSPHYTIGQKHAHCINVLVFYDNVPYSLGRS